MVAMSQDLVIRFEQRVILATQSVNGPDEIEWHGNVCDSPDTGSGRVCSGAQGGTGKRNQNMDEEPREECFLENINVISSITYGIWAGKFAKNCPP